MRTPLKNIALFGMIGLALNLAIALGPWQQGLISEPIELKDWPAPVPSDWPSRPLMCLCSSTFNATITYAIWTSPERSLRAERAESGWPLRTLGVDFFIDNNTLRMRYGLNSFRTPTQNYCLPYRPVWRGLISNTLLFGVGAWAIWAGFLAAKRHRRRSQGRCLQCGYPLGGIAICPECGHGASQNRNVPCSSKPPSCQ